MPVICGAAPGSTPNESSADKGSASLLGTGVKCGADMAGRVKGDAFAAAVPKVINTMANMTSLSGSLLRPPVIDAMSVVSAKFVDMHALYDAAGDRIAALCRAPAGYTAHVVCGAAAGLAHATAASLTKDDHAKIRLLPDTSSFERRVVLLDAAGDPRCAKSCLTAKESTETPLPVLEFELNLVNLCLLLYTGGMLQLKSWVQRCVELEWTIVKLLDGNVPVKMSPALSGLMGITHPQRHHRSPNCAKSPTRHAENTTRSLSLSTRHHVSHQCQICGHLPVQVLIVSSSPVARRFGDLKRLASCLGDAI